MTSIIRTLRTTVAVICGTTQAVALTALPMVMLLQVPTASAQECRCSLEINGECQVTTPLGCSLEESDGSGGLGGVSKGGTYGFEILDKQESEKRLAKGITEFFSQGKNILAILRDALYMVAVGAVIYGGFKMLGQGGGQDRTFVARIAAVVILGAAAGAVVGWLSGAMVPLSY